MKEEIFLILKSEQNRYVFINELIQLGEINGKIINFIHSDYNKQLTLEQNLMLLQLNNSLKLIKYRSLKVGYSYIDEKNICKRIFVLGYLDENENKTFILRDDVILIVDDNIKKLLWEDKIRISTEVILFFNSFETDK